MKRKYIELNHQLKVNDFLVHASHLPNIKKLKPGTQKKLYATDNLCMAIPNAVKKYGFPVTCVTMYEYYFMKRQFSFCSIASEYVRDVTNIRLTAYFFLKNDFTISKKYSSNLQKLSFGLIDTHGHEYVSDKKIAPLLEVSFTLDELFYYSTHNLNNSKKIIALKLLKKHITNWSKNMEQDQHLTHNKNQYNN